MPATPHVSFVDGLRGIAVLLVVAYHAQAHSLIPDIHLPPFHLPVPGVFGGGVLGVELFFFISGFVLFIPYARHLLEGAPRPTLAHFYGRRARKIVPSYVVCVLLVAAFAPSDVPPNEGIVRHTLVHLAFLHGLWPSTFTSIEGPLWSLAIEVEFYVLFPLVALIFLRSVPLGAALLFALSAAYRIGLAQRGATDDFFQSYALPAFFDLFGAGMLAAYLTLRARARDWPIVRAPMTATLIALGAIVLFYGFLNELTAQPGGPGVWRFQNAYRDVAAALLVALTVAGTAAAPALRGLVANPCTLGLAAISYNLYLWHLPLIVFVDRHRGAFAHWPHPELWIGAANVVVLLGVAWLATRYVERPLLRGGWDVLLRPLRLSSTATQMRRRSSS